MIEGINEAVAAKNLRILSIGKKKVHSEEEKDIDSNSSSVAIEIDNNKGIVSEPTRRRASNLS